MKLAKMSLVAALALTANMYAIDNVKVNGDVKVYYGTADSDVTNAPDIFSQDASYADAALHLGLTADLSEGVSAGISVTAVSTLGLENNLVNNTWSNSHGISGSTGASFPNQGAGGLQLDDAMWIDEAWIAGTAFDTTAKLGRQALDTPLAFTETWGIDTNTFEAAVLINQSIPDTTIVATYIGKSNGSADDESPLNLNAVPSSTPALGGTSAAAGYVALDGKFNTFGTNGVYAAGIINNSFKPLTVQAWYYDLQSLAKAYWLQADIKCSLVKGLLIGAQYANKELDSQSSDDTSMYSVMLGYEMKDVVTVKAAYSSVDDDGVLDMTNTATGGQSKMYTEMWWSYGFVSAVGADSYSVTAEGTVGPEVDLLLGYYYADIDAKTGFGTQAKQDISEIAFTATKSFGPLDTTLALIYDDVDLDDNTVDEDSKTTSLQVYLTYNF